ncbi:MAG: hypothetical protein ACRD5F_07230 [Candidatus Acidiferrales bacterium]
MDNPLHNPEPPDAASGFAWRGAADSAQPWYDPDRQRRRTLLRRLRVLLLAGLVLFTLALWLLVRVPDPLERLGLLSGPKRVVRAHLAALSRGEAREAYEFFSTHYREEIPWPAYERMITSHREMFRTRVLALRDRADLDPGAASGDGFDPDGESASRARPDDDGRARTVLDGELLAANGRRYMVRFTIVEDAGGWWIDRVRWSQVPTRDRFLRT